MWMQGIFGLKLQNSSKLPPIYAHYTVMQMTKVNSEKGYFMYIYILLSGSKEKKDKIQSESTCGTACWLGDGIQGVSTTQKVCATA